MLPNVYSRITLIIKLGIAIPHVASTIIKLSANLPRLYAERHPSGMPTRRETRTAIPASFADTGNLEK